MSTRQAVFGAAVDRVARSALLVENDNTGYDQGFVTAKPLTVEQEASRLVDERFERRFGWPLPSRARVERDRFLGRVRDRIEALR